MARRYCPLCDAPCEGAQCEVHRVPTIHLDGPRGPLERLEVGTELVGRYRIEGLLQQGGMGVLLAATRTSDAREVVVKVLKGQRVHDRANVRRFYQEARVASSLDHPNVVRILEFGVDEATRAPFLVMELVIGQTLKTLVARQGPLSEAGVADVFGQISAALVAAHEEGVLHRDLKPSNVMVSSGPDGAPVVKVLDFGLAKIVDDESVAPLTQPGKTVGTPAFMSPEQVTQRPQDFRSDLYGLGCMLYAALTGGPPFVGEDLVSVMRMQMRAPPPRLPEALSDGAPPSDALIRLYRQLLEKDPAKRPESTAVVARTFAELRIPGRAASQLSSTLPREPVAESPPHQTLVDAPALTDTEPSIEVMPVRLPSIGSTSDPTALSAEADDGSSDARTALEAQGLDTELAEAYEDDAIDDADTPLAIEGLDLEGLGVDTPSSTDDILTTVLPQSLDEASDPFGEDPAEGPVFGDSLLVPRPWPTRLDAQDTTPIEPAYGKDTDGAVTIEPEPRDDPAPDTIRVPDPADRAPARGAQGPSQSIMFATLTVAAVLVGLAAGAVWLRPGPSSAPKSPAAPATTEPPTRPEAAPRARARPDRRGVRVETRPDGAKVAVDGKVRGTTPLWIPRPEAGAPVQVTLQKEGFAEARRTLRADAPTVLRIELSPSP